MASNSVSNSRPGNPPNRISPKKLWFGFATSAAAWTLAGILNVFLAWQACMGGEAAGGTPAFRTPWFQVMLGFITFGLLILAVIAGVTSYRNWRRLSQTEDFIDSEARSRKEYMALCGVFISASLGFGIALFAIPVYILGVCVRSR